MTIDKWSSEKTQKLILVTCSEWLLFALIDSSSAPLLKPIKISINFANLEG